METKVYMMENDQVEEMVGMKMEEIDNLGYDWEDMYPVVEKGVVVDVYDVQTKQTDIKKTPHTRLDLHESQEYMVFRKCSMCGEHIDEWATNDEDGHAFCDECGNDIVFHTDETGDVVQTIL